MMASADLRDELNCSICLNIYTDPVTLGCGHNFCKICIGNELDNQKESGIYSCPECRAEYRTRPKLHKNMTLCNIAKRFRFTQPAENVTGISCTYCVHAILPAAKTCLLCEASLCETHLKVHSQSAEHVLIDPTTYQEKTECTIHKEILNYYCATDAVCICTSCSLASEHQGHRVETLNEAHEKKKQRLRNAMDELNKQTEEAEKEIQDLSKHKNEVKEKADRLKERVTALIMGTRKQLEALEKKVLLEISMQEEQVSLQISDLIQQLENKKLELSKEMGPVEKLRNMANPLVVLQARELISTERNDVLKKAQDLRVDELSGTFKTGLADIITDLKRTHIIIEISKTLLDVNTSPDILLDKKTAYKWLNVSSDFKTVSTANPMENRPETPERFEFYPQVLSTWGFTSGQHYWEVETSGDSWIIGMAYPSIDRKGRQSYNNYNAINPHYYGGHNYAGNQPSQFDGINSYIGDYKSWRLRLSNNMYSVISNGTVTELKCKQSVPRIRIYVDYNAGWLSFYELSYHLTHLHTFTACFTEPLHVAICVWRNASVTIIN